MSEEQFKDKLSETIYSESTLYPIRVKVTYSINDGTLVITLLDMHYISRAILPSSVEIALELYKQEYIKLSHIAFINSHDVNNIVIKMKANININIVEVEAVVTI